MAELKLTKEHIKHGIIDPLAVVYGFAKTYIKNEDAEEITDYALDAFANAQDATVDDLLDAAIKAAKTFAEISETKLDDKLVELAEVAAKVKKGEAKPAELIGKLLEIIGPAIKLAKEAREAKKAEKESGQ